MRDFPGNLVVENLPSNAGDAGSIPGRGTNTPYDMGGGAEPECRDYWTYLQLEKPHAATEIPRAAAKIWRNQSNWLIDFKK